MVKRWVTRMGRNTELGDGCRTMFLPTVGDLAKWWTQNRARYPVMGYYRPWLSILARCRDENAECEWVAGPSVEAVVRQMIQHLGLSVEAVWSDGHWDGPEWLDGWWSIPDLDECPETKDAHVCVEDPSMDAVEASNSMLRQLPDKDQDVLRVFSGPSMDDFIASEVATRDDMLAAGGTDFYGHQNESREPPQSRARKRPGSEIKAKAGFIARGLRTLEEVKRTGDYATAEEVIAQLERMLDGARGRLLEQRVPAELMALAVSVFGSEPAAREWFLRPAMGLNQTRP